MKKSMMALVISFFIGGVPVQAVTMPKVSMPKFDLNAAKKQLDQAKDRVVNAMKTNKKAIIVTAFAAFLAALARYNAKQYFSGPKAQTQQGATPVEESIDIYALMNDPQGNIDLFINAIEELKFSTQLVEQIAKAPIAQSMNNKAALLDFFNEPETQFQDLNARAKALELFGGLTVSPKAARLGLRLLESE